jgi:flotillin
VGEDGSDVSLVGRTGRVTVPIPANGSGEVVVAIRVVPRAPPHGTTSRSQSTAQAGPLAEAKAQQDVIAEQTALAERAAALTDKKLESQVRRPADAEAYKQRTLAEPVWDAVMHSTEGEAFRQRKLAEASRDTTLLNTEAEAARKRELAKAEADAQRASAHGAADARKAEADADAFAQRTTASAEAEATNARAAALSGDNQPLIAANKLVEMLPALVTGPANGISGSNPTILNGSQGLSEMAVGLAGHGMSIFEALRRSLARPTRATDGKAETAEDNGRALSAE